jgi:hypothetical protein
VDSEASPECLQHMAGIDGVLNVRAL